MKTVIPGEPVIFRWELTSLRLTQFSLSVEGSLCIYASLQKTCGLLDSAIFSLPKKVTVGARF